MFRADVLNIYYNRKTLSATILFIYSWSSCWSRELVTDSDVKGSQM